jgi:hypothetical protein
MQYPMIEAIEPRQLLSAAPSVPQGPAIVVSARRVAAKAPAAVIGVYTGQLLLGNKVNGFKPHAATLTIPSEDSTGALAGSLSITGSGNFNFTGQLTRGRHMDLKLTRGTQVAGTVGGFFASKNQAITAHFSATVKGRQVTGPLHLRFQPTLSNQLIQSQQLQLTNTNSIGLINPASPTPLPPIGTGILGSTSGGLFGGTSTGIFG